MAVLSMAVESVTLRDGRWLSQSHLKGRSFQRLKIKPELGYLFAQMKLITHLMSISEDTGCLVYVCQFFY